MRVWPVSKPILLKLGGSLLEWSELPQALDQLISRIDEPLALLIGGGKMADCLRDWHHRHRSTEESSHWRAIQVLDLTCDMVRELNPRFLKWANVHPPWSTNPIRKMVWVVQPLKYLESTAIAGSDTFLPRNWSSTSDSIALKLASDWNCSRLLLLKSCDLPHGDWDDCARTGHVDPAFPLLLQSLQTAPEIEWINLRNFAPPITNS